MEAGTDGTGAAGYAASEGVLEAVEVGRVLGWEGVHGCGVVRRWGGMGSHGDMVGRGALGVQRARVREETWVGRVERTQIVCSPAGRLEICLKDTLV